MAAKKAQRWGILVVAIVMVVGTLGSFAVMILAQQSNSKLQANYAAAEAKFTKEQNAYQALQTAQSDELSKQYYDSFKQYSSQVGTFDLNGVSALTTEDIVAGDGNEITGTTPFATYYIGWDANGHVFDQSIDTANSKLKAPFTVDGGLDSASVIDGWKEGIKGMRLGGVRLLTIPSDKAYKEAGVTDSSTGQVSIAPNMPLKFVVMAIPMPKAIDQPASYIEALSEYQRAYAAYSGAQ